VILWVVGGLSEDAIFDGSRLASDDDVKHQFLYPIALPSTSTVPCPSLKPIFKIQFSGTSPALLLGIAIFLYFWRRRSREFANNEQCVFSGRVKREPKRRDEREIIFSY
jgi:hypothetical protein